MKRKKKHPEWVFVRAYQKFYGLSDEYLAKRLGVSTRTYNDKINGWIDFSSLEAKELQCIFGVPQDELFRIKNVSHRNNLSVF